LNNYKLALGDKMQVYVIPDASNIAPLLVAEYTVSKTATSTTPTPIVVPTNIIYKCGMIISSPWLLVC